MLCYKRAGEKKLSRKEDKKYWVEGYISIQLFIGVLTDKVTFE